MLCNIEFKKVEIDHSFYFVKTRLFCPFCKDRASHKTRKYDSLKSLEYHVTTEHKTGGTSQFTVNEIRKIMQVLALAMQIGMLEYDQKNLQRVRPTIFPKIKRSFDERPNGDEVR
jgi:hypothetical protein